MTLTGDLFQENKGSVKESGADAAFCPLPGSSDAHICKHLPNDYMTVGKLSWWGKQMLTFMVRMTVLLKVEVDVDVDEDVIMVDGLTVIVARKKWMGVCVGTSAKSRWVANPLARDTCYWQSPCVSRDLAVPPLG